MGLRIKFTFFSQKVFGVINITSCFFNWVFLFHSILFFAAKIIQLFNIPY